MSLPRDLASLDEIKGCSAWDAGTVTRLGRTYDRTTPRRTLECSLSIVRQESVRTISRSTLGSRLCFLLADSETDSDRRRLLAAEGVRWAEIAIHLGAWLDGEVHYYFAVNLGLAVQDTVVIAIKNLPRLEEELKAAVQHAPEVDGGGPERVLGMLYLQAPSWPKGIGDGDKAVQILAKVAWQYPEHPLNHIFLAQALWEVEGEEALDEIRTHLDDAARLLGLRNWGYAHKQWHQGIMDLATDIGVEEFLDCEHIHCGG